MQKYGQEFQNIYEIQQPQRDQVNGIPRKLLLRVVKACGIDIPLTLYIVPHIIDNLAKVYPGINSLVIEISEHIDPLSVTICGNMTEKDVMKAGWLVWLHELAHILHGDCIPIRTAEDLAISQRVKSEQITEKMNGKVPVPEEDRWKYELLMHSYKEKEKEADRLAVEIYNLMVKEGVIDENGYYE